MANIIPSNQIIKLQTDKKLISFYDKLEAVDVNKYAQIHAKGEKEDPNGKRQSLIGLTLQDYSNGTGANNIIVNFNLTPEILQFLFTRVSGGILEFDWSQDKIYGDPDQNGLSYAQRIQISRHTLKKDGTVSNYPWFIAVSNGKGVKVQGRTGGYYMKGNSYVQEKAVFINLSDMDLFTLLKRVDSFVNAWEKITAGKLVEEGRRSFNEYKTNNRQSGYQNTTGNNYRYPQQPSQTYIQQSQQPYMQRPQQAYYSNGYMTGNPQTPVRPQMPYQDIRISCPGSNEAV